MELPWKKQDARNSDYNARNRWISFCQVVAVRWHSGGHISATGSGDRVPSVKVAATGCHNYTNDANHKIPPPDARPNCLPFCSYFAYASQKFASQQPVEARLPRVYNTVILFRAWASAQRIAMFVVFTRANWVTINAPVWTPYEKLAVAFSWTKFMRFICQLNTLHILCCKILV